MKLSRRRFIASGIGLTGTALAYPPSLFTAHEMVLDRTFIDQHARQIEKTILSAIEAHYLNYTEVFDEHYKPGLILPGYKSKNDPNFSTFRVGDDAYTVRTGELVMGNGWAEAKLFYNTFNARIRWEISKTAKLILSSDSDQIISSIFPITDERYVRTDHNYTIKYLKGFSPYSEGNKAEDIKSLMVDWKKELVIEFVTP